MPLNSIMALDLATSIGWARWRAPATIASGTKLLPKTGPDVGAFVDKFESWLADMISVDRPELVVFEAPMVYEGTNQETARKLLGLAVMAEFVCRRAEVRYLEVNVADVRSHFLGTGYGKHSLRIPGESKPWQQAVRMTFAQCQARGWLPDTDDEADALAVLDYSAWCLRNQAHVSWDCRPAGEWRTGPDGRLRLVGDRSVEGQLPGLEPVGKAARRVVGAAAQAMVHAP